MQLIDDGHHQLADGPDPSHRRLTGKNRVKTGTAAAGFNQDAELANRRHKNRDWHKSGKGLLPLKLVAEQLEAKFLKGKKLLKGSHDISFEVVKLFTQVLHVLKICHVLLDTSEQNIISCYLNTIE